MRTLSAIILIIALIIGVFAVLGMLERVTIRGMVIDEAGRPILAIPIGIYINHTKVGLITSELIDSKTYNFVYQMSNSFGFQSDFPGEQVIVDLGQFRASDPPQIVVKNGIVVSAEPNTNIDEQISPPPSVSTQNIILLSASIITFVITALSISRLSLNSKPVIVPKPVAFPIYPDFENASATLMENNEMSEGFIPVAIGFLIKVGEFAMTRLQKLWSVTDTSSADSAPIKLRGQNQAVLLKHVENTLSTIDPKKQEKLRERISELETDLDVLELQRDELERGFIGGTIAQIHYPAQLHLLDNRQKKLLEKIKILLTELGISIVEEPQSKQS